MAELGLDMFNKCFKIAIWFSGIVMVLLILGVRIWELEVPKDHCIKCDRVICDEKYCPNCGTSTDSVNTYNYWNKPKEE